MKRFLKKILLFVLPLFALSYPIDIGLSYLLSRSHDCSGEFEVMNDVYSSRADYELAIYGSSRAWVQIDPQILSDSLKMSAYNYGIDGHNFWLQYLRHLEILKHNRRPKLILLSLDVFTLQKYAELYQPEQFLPYMLWNNNVRAYTSSYIGYNKMDYYVPLLRYAGKSKALKACVKVLLKKDTVVEYRHKGFLGIEKGWNKDLEIAKAENLSFKSHFDKASVEVFEKFIIECQQSNIKLIFVYTPEFVEGQQFVSNRAEVIRVFKNFADEYKLPFYDYSNDLMCSDKSLFYNAGHLNKNGAEMFSKKLAHDLKNVVQVFKP